MSGFVHVVEQHILARKLFREAQSILVAVSGGLDSVALLGVLHRLSVAHGWKLTVAHFNHRLRGRSSDADERFVKRLAARLKLPCVTGSADVQQFGREHKVSLEMAARKLRHDFLARSARRRKIRTIALAHHADDQVELFFVRLLRGAGPEGLSGMKWSNPSPADSGIALVRPFLGCSREAIETCAREQKIDFREDTTNASHDMLRNRVRQELLPLLRKYYQPAIGKTVLRAMELIEAESAFVGQRAADWLTRKRPRFENLAPAVQRRVLQEQLIQAGLKVDFDLVEHLRLQPHVPVTIHPGRTVVRDVAGCIQSGEVPRVDFNPTRKVVNLKAGQGRAQFEQVVLRWQVELANGREYDCPASAPGREYFDADKIGSSIVLRHWQKGDRFRPIGMPTSVKLQDLFSNQKIARARRHQLTVATTPDGELFWVEGLRISDRFKLDKATVRRLKWDWRRCE